MGESLHYTLSYLVTHLHVFEYFQQNLSVIITYFWFSGMLLLLPINIFLALSPGYEDLYNYVISISS